MTILQLHYSLCNSSFSRPVELLVIAVDGKYIYNLIKIDMNGTCSIKRMLYNYHAVAKKKIPY